MLSILLQAGQAGGLLGLLPFVLILIVMYLFMIRPQQKKAKEQQKFISELKAGDKIVTIGGMHGVIDQVGDTTLILQIAKDTKITIERNSVAAGKWSDEKAA